MIQVAKDATAKTTPVFVLFTAGISSLFLLSILIFLSSVSVVSLAFSF